MARGRKSSLPHYSPELWADIQPALQHLEANTLRWSEQVLVEQRSISAIAGEAGVNRQTVHKAVTRVLAIVADHLEEDLRPVLVWVTEHQVPAVMALAAQYSGAKADTKSSQM
ncbi:TrfB-related DNA-binding protein [Pseudomonas sp. Marseille-Q5115]|uniref:TrfB-related DNA-binding protein n=1 Tax=Pseudomonas sp. Marseille-Q5115 TaxID=2866593 RepID=UPI001CE43043|nr:TrfB-related DNA-binding protein [Pseudomonas sp. Marseille-Q5115]